MVTSIIIQTRSVKQPYHINTEVQIRIVVMYYFHALKTLSLRQDGCHFADDIFTCIFFNEYCCILIKFSLKYVRKGPIDNNPALVQIMAWCRSGHKPLSEPMMVILLMHICVTRPQWVNQKNSKKKSKWSKINSWEKCPSHFRFNKNLILKQATNGQSIIRCLVKNF